MTATLAAVAEALAALGELGLLVECPDVSWGECNKGDSGKFYNYTTGDMCTECHGTGYVPRTDAGMEDVLAALARAGYDLFVERGPSGKRSWRARRYMPPSFDSFGGELYGWAVEFDPTDAASIHTALLAAAYDAVHAVSHEGLLQRQRPCGVPVAPQPDRSGPAACGRRG